VKCIVHDYCGHPFQAGLSRHLARRGHEITHLFFADNPGPKGSFQRSVDDPSTLHFRGLSLGATKCAAGTGAIGLSRVLRDFAYGKMVAQLIQDAAPDVVLCGNTPLDAQRTIIRACRRLGIRFIYWVQDLYSAAVATLLTQKLGHAGKAIGWYYHRVNRRQFRASDGIVTISQDFAPLIEAIVGEGAPISVIENWATVADLPVRPKDNPWSRTHGLDQRFAYLYSGTLGRKHNWEFLLKLAERCRHDDMVVVAAQGHGVPRLQAAASANGISVKLLPIQPAEHLADLLGTADVLLATIDAESGTFAVPSKVLSYLCAGRPILLAASRDNLAARTVERANAGIVVGPGDEAGFVAAAELLRGDATLRTTLGANGRDYAERVFNLETITDRFETVLQAKARNIRLPSTMAAAEWQKA
jgi:colanic acid biosynthesis glycosyl transferase WcaI